MCRLLEVAESATANDVHDRGAQHPGHPEVAVLGRRPATARVGASRVPRWENGCGNWIAKMLTQ